MKEYQTKPCPEGGRHEFVVIEEAENGQPIRWECSKCLMENGL
jgi:hypothetical protein